MNNSVEKSVLIASLVKKNTTKKWPCLYPCDESPCRVA